MGLEAGQVKEWCVYILACSDGSLYTGCTNYLQARMKKHRSGKGAKYTRSRLPVELVYSVSCLNKSDALRLEARIKRRSRVQKLALVT
ncbi:MAG: hypothetical protein A2Z21_01965 [Candidatus Fraserbacteria bacterium RBG_16_55_9]|uniref:GIY-YIG domain-containing protein n=1 Tax=Fraserbacteria sp. (strain RBG_16_55_9) TaxID=1817864 RepID=A0A1F5UPB1_FRAXR|nr:MAG: hypothetical protein A2Z21_01965 [Candidatus Fraserbacteria bacterium RBG_16_55_9]